MINNVEHHAVLIPTAPIPVGGSLMLVPVKSIQPADMTVEHFISIYLSMGASGSQYIPKSMSEIS
jgi:uncharacterized membrane protein